MAAIGSAPNSKVVLMPLEASSLIGSLGGIGAIAREVFGNEVPARPAQRPQHAVARPPLVGPENQ